MDIARRTRWLLCGIVFGAGLLLALVYIVAVRTRWGQQADATVLRGRHVLDPEDITLARHVHSVISIASIVVVGGIVVFVALARRRVRLALGVVILVGGSLATTELLKRILDRPDLGVADGLRQTNAYPSGHTTVAFALGLSATLVSPRQVRALVALAAATFAAAIGVSVVATASHRPSDAIGAMFVVAAWTAAVAAMLCTNAQYRPASARAKPWLVGFGAALFAALLAAVATVGARHYHRLRAVVIGRAFAVAALAIVGTALICAAAVLFALDSIELGESSKGRPRDDGRT